MTTGICGTDWCTFLNTAVAIATAVFILAYARSHRGRIAILRARYAEARERFLAWQTAEPNAPQMAQARAEMHRAWGELGGAMLFQRLPVEADGVVPAPQYAPNPAPPLPPVPRPPPAPVAPPPPAGGPPPPAVPPP